MNVVISPLAAGEPAVEMVERKGLGHPDSICDALAQTLSANLCRHYLDRFGVILHHNVDKVLLCGGSSRAAFGGGEVTAPAEIYLSGRATATLGDVRVPVAELAIEGSRRWLRENLHGLDADRHVVLHDKVRPGSRELAELFARSGRPGSMPLANDTSIGVGYAPMSALERLVLKIERTLNGRARAADRPAWGEDIKVMGVRRGRAVSLTVACALIGRHVPDLDAYVGETAEIRRRILPLAAAEGFDDCHIGVNAADHIATGSIYLTVTGTSAEAGDDGEVGRGNRVNGLITPFRPMSLEAAAGKNPVSHVGLLYNVAARRIAEAIVASLPQVEAAQCYLVSQIGQPIDRPQVAHLRLAGRDGAPIGSLGGAAEEILRRELSGLPALSRRFADGAIELF